MQSKDGQKGGVSSLFVSLDSSLLWVRVAGRDEEAVGEMFVTMIRAMLLPFWHIIPSGLNE